jgi:hypothetical protein
MIHIFRLFLYICKKLSQFLFCRPHDRTTGRAGSPLMNHKIKLVNWEEGGYLVTLIYEYFWNVFNS